MAADPARRREALRIGLQGLKLPESQVLAALNLWDQDYAVTQPAALAEYVKDLSQRLAYSIEERHQLRVALYVAIARHDGRMIPSAPPPMPAPRNGTTPATAAAPVAAARPPSPPAYTVFAFMAGEMLKAVNRDGLGSVDDFTLALEQHCSAQRLPVDMVVALNRWSRQVAGLETLSTHPAGGFGAAMHAIYAAAAEAIGPTEADRQLARAVNSAETLPEAQAFSPRRLL